MYHRDYTTEITIYMYATTLLRTYLKSILILHVINELCFWVLQALRSDLQNDACRKSLLLLLYCSVTQAGR